MKRPRTRAEHRLREREALRGHLAMVIANTPSHLDRPIDELLAVAGTVMATFNVSRKATR